MKRNHIKLLLAAGCVLLCAGALAACRQDVLTLEDLKEEGYTCEIVFDLAGGVSGEGDRIRSELHQYAKVGSPIVKPGEDQFSGAAPTREGYTFGGYYRGSKSEDGTVEYDMTSKWDFKKDKVQGDLTLYAYWRENYSLTIHYGENFRNTRTVNVSQSEDGEAQSVSTPAIPGYTTIAYYGSRAEAEAKDETHALTFPQTPTDKYSAGNKTWEIWADALEGTYTLVREASDFKLYAGTNLYLLANIDLGNKEIDFPDTYSGKFYGNGHTVSNFTVKRKTASRGNDYLGLFRRLAAGALLDNVTFSNFSLELETTGNYDYVLGTLAGRASAGATVRNVTLSGTVTYKLADAEGEAPSPFIGETEAGVVTEGCNYDGVVVTEKTS